MQKADDFVVNHQLFATVSYCIHKRVAELIHVLKYIIDKSGFKLVSRIELRDKKTGKEFR